MKPPDQTIHQVSSQNLRLLLCGAGGPNHISKRRAQLAYLFAITSQRALGIFLIFVLAFGYGLGKFAELIAGFIS